MTLKQLLAVGLVGAIAHPALINAGNQPTDRYDSWRDRPIKHLVVIFDENISFDHYFGTYPNAMNPAGEPAFHASADTPTVNGLEGALLTNNPNKSPPTAPAPPTPSVSDRTQAWTASQNHDYMPEQAAFDKRPDGSVPGQGRHARQRRDDALRARPRPPASRWATTTATP